MCHQTWRNISQVKGWPCKHIRVWEQNKYYFRIKIFSTQIIWKIDPKQIFSKSASNFPLCVTEVTDCYADTLLLFSPIQQLSRLLRSSLLPLVPPSFNHWKSSGFLVPPPRYARWEIFMSKWYVQQIALLGVSQSRLKTMLYGEGVLTM